MRIELERREVEAILNILAERPYSQVYQLIGKIVQQTQPQMQPKPSSNGQIAKRRSPPSEAAELRS